MRRTIGRLVPVVLLWALSALAESQERSPKAPEQGTLLIVRVYNQAEVSSGILKGGTTVAARIFQEMRIPMLWVDCPLSSEDAVRIEACQPGVDTNQLNLRIIPRFDLEAAGFKGAALGFALTDQQRGVNASVFYHRVEQVAKEKRASAKIILGHAMAHEIGHLLLGSNSHSNVGMMRAQWNEAELKKATLALLRFTPEEGATIQVEARQRIILGSSRTSGEVK